MNLQKKITVAIADSHPLMRQGIKDIINSDEGFEVIIEASDGAELISCLQIATCQPDICVLDTNMQYIRALKEIKCNWQPMKVLIFSLFHSEFIIHEMVCNGANGYLEKTCSNGRMIQALRNIHNTGYYFSGPTAKRIYDMHKRHMMPRITDREMEFLCHCCSDLTYREISKLMGVSVRTVDNYRDVLFSKFKIKTRTGLVLFALQNGLVPLTGEMARAN